MNKKGFVIIFAILLMFVMVMPIPTVSAISSTYSPSEKVYMCDDADLLTSSEELLLKELAREYVEHFDLNVLFLTTDHAAGKSTMVYSDDYMDELFPSGVENNIAFVIDMDNREIYINTMGIAIQRMYDSEIEEALDLGYEYITDGDYYNTMSAMASYCLDNIVNNRTTSTDNYDDGEEGFVTYMIWPGLLVAGIATGLFVFFMISNHNAANQAQSATKYLSTENYKVSDKDEILIKTYETVQRDYYKPKSSSSGGGGSSHRSSSGRSHGGGGRRF